MSAKAVGYLELNIAGFDQALKTAKNLMAGFAAGFSAYKIGEFFKDGIKGAIDFGKEMNTASRQMGGFGAGNLLLVQKALENVGYGADEARSNIDNFIKSGRNISSMFGGSENYAKALESSSKNYGAQAEILNRSAERLQTVFNTLASIGEKMKTFFLAMTERFIGPLQFTLDRLNETDLSGVGERFGKAISNAVTTLYGVFQNGQIIEFLKTGLILGFQEAVNYLVGGFNFIIGKIPEWMISAFRVSVEFLSDAVNAIFNVSLLDSFLFVANSFVAALLDGVSMVVKFLQAGTGYAVMQAIQSIPGAGKLLGIGEEPVEFGDVYESLNDSAIDKMVKKIRDSADYFADSASQPLVQLFRQLDFTGDKGFEKADIFGSETQNRLKEIMANGFKIGSEEFAKSEVNNPNAPSKSVLTSMSGASSKVIADSLAKVGGGGGFIRVGITLAERTQMDQLRAQRQANDLLESINKKTGKSQPALMRR